MLFLCPWGWESLVQWELSSFFFFIPILWSSLSLNFETEWAFMGGWCLILKFGCYLREISLEVSLCSPCFNAYLDIHMRDLYSLLLRPDLFYFIFSVLDWSWMMNLMGHWSIGFLGQSHSLTKCLSHHYLKFPLILMYKSSIYLFSVF